MKCCVGLTALPATAVAVLILIASRGSTSADPPTAAKTPAAETDFVEIRCLGEFEGYRLFQTQADKFRQLHPSAGVGCDGPEAPGLEIAEQLAAGRLEIGVLAGPIYRHGSADDTSDRPRSDAIMDILTKSKCDYTVIARNAMAVVVHPQNPLSAIDQAQVEQILQRKVTSWNAFGQEDRPIQVVTDNRAYRILRQCPKSAYAGDISSYKIHKAFEQVARDRSAIGFICIDQPLAASG